MLFLLNLFTEWISRLKVMTVIKNSRLFSKQMVELANS